MRPRGSGRGITGSFARQVKRTDAIERAPREKYASTEFLAVMSHELRTPLNAISGYVTLLEMGIRGPLNDQQREDLQRIRRSQEQLLTLINQVLSFARIEAGEVELTIEDFEVNSLVQELGELVHPQIIANGLRYSFATTASELVAHADRDKLRQIVLNILINAIKFTEGPGRIDMSTDRKGNTIEIRISDSGPGIPANRVDRIFDPFTRVDRHVGTGAQQGVGLGLAISRELARAMFGDVRVASVEGEGSVFTISVPVGATRG